ncbi:MAG: glycan-binding surface protein [Leadbetterella sp.]
MKKNSFFTICGLAISSLFLLGSCNNEDSAVTPTGLTISPAQVSAGDLVTIKGANLAGLERVIFGGAEALINPVYNTDGALLVRVPTGTKFGNTDVVLMNKGGESTMATIKLKILQPKPVITGFSPEKNVPGTLVTIEGSNFTGPNFPKSIEVRVGDVIAEIVSLEPTKIVIKMPSKAGKITVNTGIGALEGGGGIIESKNALDLQEKLYYVITNFDGAEDGGWYIYGDMDGTNATGGGAGMLVKDKDPAPKSGKFGVIANVNARKVVSYAGSGHNKDIPTAGLISAGMTSQNSAIRLDVHNNGRKGTVIYVRINDKTRGGGWQKEVKLDKDGWNEITIPLTELVNYRSDVKGTIEVKDIKIIDLGFPGTGYTSTPYECNFDNIRFVGI